jgi:hypothetical protein
MALWLPQGRDAGEILANAFVLKYRQDRTEDTRDAHRSEDRAALLHVGIIAFPKYQRHCSESGVKYSPRERDPKAEEEHYGFDEQQMDRPADRILIMCKIEWQGIEWLRLLGARLV